MPTRWRSVAIRCLAWFAFAAATSAHAASAGSGGAAAGETHDSAHDWPLFGFDVGRSNVSTAPAGIDARSLSSLVHQEVQVGGTVDASPIYLRGVTVGGAAHDVFFVTTTYGLTVAVDADDGSTLWKYTPSGYDSWAGSYRITTATPAADPDGKSLYAASPDGFIQKLSVGDGHVLWRTAVTELPQREKIPSALSFHDGRVLATTGGYIGDQPPYVGHVAVLDAASGKLLHVWNALCSDRSGLIDPRSCPESGAAIWGRAGVVIEAASGNLLVATGNGRWNGRTDWGDAVLVLSPDATRLVGNWTPENTEGLWAHDLDLGSTSPALLGEGLLAQGGKAGRIHLLSKERIEGRAPHRGGSLQTVATPQGVDLFTAPAVLHAKGNAWLVVADNRGTAAWILHERRLEQKWHNRRAGTSPVIAGGLLYVYDPHGGLHVYEPETGRRLASFDCGGGHWNSPIVVDGRIALPVGNGNAHRTSGVLEIWRLPGT